MDVFYYLINLSLSMHLLISIELFSHPVIFSFSTSVEVKEKRKKTKPVNFQDLASKRPER